VVNQSPIQTVALVRQTTGEPFYLRLGEELLASSFTPGQVMLIVQTVTIKEYAVGYRVTKQGTRLLIWTQAADGSWSCNKTTTWDPDFTPYEVGTRGGKSERDYREQVRWEDDCYRPGNGSRLGQRDSADRASQGYDYTNPQFYSTTTRKR